MKRILFTILALTCWAASAAQAGPNEGGTLIFHTDTSVTYTGDNDPYLGASGLDCPAVFDCPEPDACWDHIQAANPTGRVDGTNQVWWVFAAFPEGSCPRLSGVTFGHTWDDEANLYFVSSGAAGDFELPTSGWPDTIFGEGTAITWAAPQQNHLTEVYWFAGYAYYGEETIQLTAHPTQGANFADDAVPANLDPIAGLSSLGLFGATGENILPIAAGDPEGACCFSDGSCEILTEANCDVAGGTYAGNDVTCEAADCQVGEGACCFASGACVVLTQDICENKGEPGVYQGDDEPCEPNPCPQLKGACCLADGSCVVTTEADCDGTYQGNDTICEGADCPQPTGACCLEDGSCQDLTEEDCDAIKGFFQADTDCEVADCPQPPAACCFADGHCELLTDEDCDSAGGLYWGDDTQCDPNPCPQPPETGACCFEDEACDIFTESDCEDEEGVYQGDDTSCDPNPCVHPEGACCFEDGSCQLLTEADCATAAGGYLGDNTSCEPNPCPQPPAACCFDDGTCEMRIEADCDNEAGEYQGDGSSCDPNPCPQPDGACCFDDGSCELYTEEECDLLEGSFEGDDTACEPNPCQQPDGACCFDDGSCVLYTEEECNDLDGSFYGDDSSCEPNPCDLPTGACCFYDGSCEVLTQEDCEQSGTAEYQGDGVTCEDADCPQPMGACCFDDGSCEVLTDEDCSEVGGTYQGDDVTCGDADCPQPEGACCFDDGGCEVLTVDVCEDAGGTYQGDDVACADADCPQPGGACCFDDGSCEVTIDEEDCVEDQGGSYQGDGTNCDPNPCDQPAACCFEDGSCVLLTEDFCADEGGAFEGSASCEPNPCEQPVGWLEVTSTPDGANIMLDGQDTGEVTPYTFELDPGDYEVEWVKPGHGGCSEKYTVVAGETTTADCEMLPYFLGLDGFDVVARPSTVDLSPGHIKLRVSMTIDGFTGGLTSNSIDTDWFFLNGLHLDDAEVRTLTEANGTVRGSGFEVTVTSEVIAEAIGALPPNAPQRFVTLDLWARLNDGRWVKEELRLMVILNARSSALSMEGEFGVIVRPNPMKSDLFIEWSNPLAAETELVIYDAGGRVLRRLMDGMQSAGAHQVQWDGTDANGLQMPSGVYYYRLRSGSQVMTNKIFMIR